MNSLKNTDIWQVVSDRRCLLGEGPIWDPNTNSILWVDIKGGDIHRFSLDQGLTYTMNVGQKIGAIALRASGGLIAALQNGFAIVNLTTQTLETITDPEKHLPDNRFNDGKCDPAGRFWAGTMDDINGKRDVGSLYAMEVDFSVSTKIANVTCSNGLAWSVDGRTLYFIDTPTRKVVAYDYKAETGKIDNVRTVVNIPANDGIPDGMTIDDEGMLWVAHWNGWKISRWDPNSGELLHNITLPVSRITSCVFGGNTLEDLYVTSAKIGLTEEELKHQPLAGSLFVIRNSGFKGIKAPMFRG